MAGGESVTAGNRPNSGRRKLPPTLKLCLLVGLFLAGVHASSGWSFAIDEGASDGTFGRGGFDLGWGKPEDDDDEKSTPTPTASPTPTPGDDSFFNGNVEDSGRGDKL